MHVVSSSHTQSLSISLFLQRTLLIQCLYFYILVIMLHIDFITLMWVELVGFVFIIYTKKGQQKESKPKQSKVKKRIKKATQTKLIGGLMIGHSPWQIEIETPDNQSAKEMCRIFKLTQTFSIRIQTHTIHLFIYLYIY